ncbi:MAG: hypothetical protein ACYTAO_03890 [Planctomycetota bacterium]
MTRWKTKTTVAILGGILMAAMFCPLPLKRKARRRHGGNVTRARTKSVEILSIFREFAEQR